MNIVHCCLAAFYIDNYSYQENILPKMHKMQGHNVEIIASTETYNSKKLISYVKPSRYINEYDIPVCRLPYSRIPSLLARKLRIYRGLKKELLRIKPDIIFLHDLQFLSILTIAKYKMNCPHVKIYIDGHTDFINSAKSFISKYILHGIVYRFCAKVIEKHVEKFWGVTPARASFFSEMYGINPNKVGLLYMGADDSSFNLEDKFSIRKNFRQKYKIGENDLCIAFGGKIDKRKNLSELLAVFESLENNVNIKLIVFGQPVREMVTVIEKIALINNVKYMGWLEPSEVNELLLSVDLVCFPGTHSILWEQSVGLGIPAIFKSWDGMRHLDVGGNCIFIENKSELEEALKLVLYNNEILMDLTLMAQKYGVKHFSYSNIAKKAIGI
ncbi:hypothetical protein VSVS12_00385 [Vibrio scophthalmi]|uniref:glycosyltransferase family 4 protein n=1 Tax=Vibrio scophthalmi TaxID=45658 RepID=UPI000809853F|nr:glycosyltransferase family 4 protein [Vibrio scophthalmi]ANS84202.1 hypothetical protein VSVS12_00385 [Vibrio scophthalmi]